MSGFDVVFLVFVALVSGYAFGLFHGQLQEARVWALSASQNKPHIHDDEAYQVVRFDVFTDMKIELKRKQVLVLTENPGMAITKEC